MDTHSLLSPALPPLSTDFVTEEDPEVFREGSVHVGRRPGSPGREEMLEMLKAALLCLWKFIHTWKSLSRELGKGGEKRENKEEKRSKKEKKREKRDRLDEHSCGSCCTQFLTEIFEGN